MSNKIGGLGLTSLIVWLSSISCQFVKDEVVRDYRNISQRGLFPGNTNSEASVSQKRRY